MTERLPVFRDPEADAAEQQCHSYLQVLLRAYQSPNSFSAEESHPKFIWNLKDPRQPEQPWNARVELQDLNISRFQNLLQTYNSHWSRDWHVSRWNRIEIPDISPCVKFRHSHLGFPDEEMVPFQHVLLGSLRVHTRKDGAGPLHSIKNASTNGSKI